MDAFTLLLVNSGYCNLLQHSLCSYPPSIHAPAMRLYAVISNGCNLACETLIAANNYTLAGLKCGKLSSACWVKKTKIKFW